MATSQQTASPGPLLGALRLHRFYLLGVLVEHDLVHRPRKVNVDLIDQLRCVHELVLQPLGVEPVAQDPVDLLHTQGRDVVRRHAVDEEVVFELRHGVAVELHCLLHPLDVAARVLHVEADPQSADPVYIVLPAEAHQVPPGLLRPLVPPLEGHHPARPPLQPVQGGPRNLLAHGGGRRAPVAQLARLEFSVVE